MVKSIQRGNLCIQKVLAEIMATITDIEPVQTEKMRTIQFGARSLQQHE
jgi:hypothetical protein